MGAYCLPAPLDICYSLCPSFPFSHRFLLFSLSLSHLCPALPALAFFFLRYCCCRGGSINAFLLVDEIGGKTRAHAPRARTLPSTLTLGACTHQIAKGSRAVHSFSPAVLVACSCISCIRVASISFSLFELILFLKISIAVFEVVKLPIFAFEYYKYIFEKKKNSVS